MHVLTEVDTTFTYFKLFWIKRKKEPFESSHSSLFFSLSVTKLLRVVICGLGRKEPEAAGLPPFLEATWSSVPVSGSRKEKSGPGKMSSPIEATSQTTILEPICLGHL